MLPRLATGLDVDAHRALWWGLANPRRSADSVGGAHNDAAMIALALVGLWVGLRGGGTPPTAWSGAPL